MAGPWVDKCQRFLTWRRGTTRAVICFGPWALKIGRGRRGRLCNLQERWEWDRTNHCPQARSVLCPFRCGDPLGFVNVMQRARPLTEEEAGHQRDEGSKGFQGGWPCSCSAPEFECKASDWGYLQNGQLVALDYATPWDCPRDPYDMVRKCGGAAGPSPRDRWLHLVRQRTHSLKNASWR